MFSRHAFYRTSFWIDTLVCIFQFSFSFRPPYLHSTPRLLSFILMRPTNVSLLMSCLTFILSRETRIFVYTMHNIGQNRQASTNLHRTYKHQIDIKIFAGIPWHCAHRWHGRDSTTIAIKSPCMNVKWQMRFISRTSAHVRFPVACSVCASHRLFRTNE